MPLHVLASLLLLATARSPGAQGTRTPPEARPAPAPSPDRRASPSAPAPLTLEEVLALAAGANAELRAARANADVTHAERGAAVASLLPRVDLSSAWGRNFVGASEGRTLSLAGVSFQAGAGPASDTAIYSLALQLSQTLFDWQRFRAVGQASGRARAAEEEVQEAALAVAFTATQRFYELVKQERSLKVHERAALRSSELVERADALFAAGRAPRSDTYAARVNLATDRIGVEAQRVRVIQARTALARVLGQSEPDGVEVIAPAALDAPGTPSADPPALEVLLARARERRPALAAGSARIEAARAAARAARAAYLPALTAQATYSRSGETLNGREGVYGDPTRAYGATAQLALAWNLFQGLGTEAEVRRAEAALAGARAADQGARAAVVEEVANARAAVVASSREASLAMENLGLARDALRLATQRFAAGVASHLEERDASLKLSQAELTLLETRIGHAVALADLARAVGGAP
jgi:outer membrane protein